MISRTPTNFPPTHVNPLVTLKKISQNLVQYEKIQNVRLYSASRGLINNHSQFFLQ